MTFRFEDRFDYNSRRGRLWKEYLRKKNKNIAAKSEFSMNPSRQVKYFNSVSNSFLASCP
ncbi:MAG: hypothetical protein K8F52_12260 [Candidatus Scalindua rubra]|nr:hypothetical protein [Candidatus Scalindua rubra]